MILLLPGYTFFLLASAPGGWRTMVRPRIIGLALVTAFAGALQYAWNFRGLWQWPNAPRRFADAIQMFWFDVTKADWRETMVLRLPESMLRDRAEMYWFDLVQQFGLAALLALLGLRWMFAANWRRAVLLLLIYGANAAFAFTYNVGDTHVFYLTSHLIVALLFAPGVILAAKLLSHGLRRRAVRADAAIVAMSIVAVGWAAARIYRDYPALDRSADHRPTEVLAALTRGLDDQHAVLLADVNWQIVNGLAYFGEQTPSLAYTWMTHVLLYAPALVGDNLAAGRDVAVTSRANRLLTQAYGPLLPTAVDTRVPVPTLTDQVQDLRAGTRYVLCLLRPSREFTFDRDDLQRALGLLAGRSVSIPDADYAVVAGVVGQQPSLAVGADAPFSRTTQVAGVRVDVRMESWLAFDTIRRMGFGHIVANHRHTLIVERGISFAAFDGDGRPARTVYLANIFAPQPRYLVRR